MPAKPRMRGTERRHKPVRWMVHQTMAIKFQDQATSRMALDHLSHPLVISPLRVIHRDNMHNHKAAWFIHKEMVRWAVIPITRIRLTANKVKSTNNVSIRQHHDAVWVSFDCTFWIGVDSACIS